MASFSREQDKRVRGHKAAMASQYLLAELYAEIGREKQEKEPGDGQAQASYQEGRVLREEIGNGDQRKDRRQQRVLFTRFRLH
jgi:hypothetical protein